MLEVMAEFTQKEILLACEDFHIYEINPEYNLAVRAGSNQGYKHTEETKQNIKKAAMRRGPLKPACEFQLTLQWHDGFLCLYPMEAYSQIQKRHKLAQLYCELLLS